MPIFNENYSSSKSAAYWKLSRFFTYLRLPNLSDLPNPWRRYLWMSIPLGFLSLNAYARHQLTRLQEKEEKINTFCETTYNQLGSFLAWQPEDKLHLMSRLDPLDLYQHKVERLRLTEWGKKLNEFRHEINDYRFSWLAKVEAICFINSFFSWSWRPLHTQLNQTNQALDRLRTALDLTDSTNLSLYYLKRRLYNLAEHSIQKGIKVTEQHPALPLQFNIFSTSHLYAQVFNLAAKVARSQNQLVQCDQYYEKAKSFLLPEDRVMRPIIMGSQVALWGDMAWPPQNIQPNVEKIKLLLEEQTYQNIYHQLKDNGLGLANLSWVFIQLAGAKKEKIDLSVEKRQELYQKAFHLADQAIPLLDPRKSINALLFRGIARMELKENESAFEDFNEGLHYDRDHPSLLRRRALVLEKLNRSEEAKTAFEEAGIELAYRLKAAELLKEKAPSPYGGWLADIKRDLKISPNTSSQSNLSFLSLKQQVISYLMEANFQQAWDSLQKISGAHTAWKYKMENWFRRHFNIEEGRLISKARDELLIRLGIYGTPTPYELMQLNIATYAAKHGKRLGLPSGWEEHLSPSQLLDPASQDSGYLGIAYRRKDTGHLVISHGGTDLTDPQELVKDLLITDRQLAQGRPFQQLKDAESFSIYILKYALAVPGMVIHTGHSLGGTIAEYLVCTQKPLGHYYAVTYDNPSCWWQITRQGNWFKPFFNRGQVNSQEENHSLKDFPITAFLTPPNFINCAGGLHIGRLIQIPIRPKISTTIVEEVNNEVKLELNNWWQTNLPKYAALLLDPRHIVNKTLTCHDKDNILATFSSYEDEIYNNEHQRIEALKASYIEKWPSNIDEWSIYGQQTNIDLLTGKSLSNGQGETQDKQTLSALSHFYQTKPLTYSHHQEIIPLSSLETEFAKQLKKILSKENNNTSPEDTQNKIELRPYLHESVLTHLKLSEDGSNIILTGTLNSWELLTYLRLQTLEACENQKKEPAKILYPTLAKFQLERNSISDFFALNKESNQSTYGIVNLQEKIDAYKKK